MMMAKGNGNDRAIFCPTLSHFFILLGVPTEFPNAWKWSSHKINYCICHVRWLIKYYRHSQYAQQALLSFCMNFNSHHVRGWIYLVETKSNCGKGAAVNDNVVVVATRRMKISDGWYTYLNQVNRNDSRTSISAYLDGRYFFLSTSNESNKFENDKKEITIRYICGIGCGVVEDCSRKNIFQFFENFSRNNEKRNCSKL